MEPEVPLTTTAIDVLQVELVDESLWNEFSGPVPSAHSSESPTYKSPVGQNSRQSLVNYYFSEL